MYLPTNTEHGLIYRNPDSFFGYCGWPSVCKDDSGVLYAVCSGFRASHVCAFGKTVLFKSLDEGKTWSPPMVINDTWLDDRDAGIICLGGNTLLVSWFCHPTEVYFRFREQDILPPLSDSILNRYNTIPESGRAGGSYIRISHDGGITWGETIKVPVSSPHGPSLRQDGSLLYLGKEMYNHDEDQPFVIAAYESRDEGKTWSHIGDIPKPEGTTWDNFHEPHAIELKDGRILGMIRAQNLPEPPYFTIYQSFSDDGGRTWTEMTPTGVYGSPPHLMRHSSGAIILVYGRRVSPFGERAIISRDEGVTWSQEYIVFDNAPDADLGYPASVELSDGSVLTVYYQKCDGDNLASLHWSRWIP